MRETYPNGHYNRYGEFAVPKEPEWCECECHMPGRNIMHCHPCCTPEKELLTLKHYGN